MSRIFHLFRPVTDFFQAYLRWFRKKWILKSILLLLILLIPSFILIYVTVFMSLEHADTISTDTTGFSVNSVNAVRYGADQQETIRQLEQMELEKAFLTTRLKLAAQDSVYLSLDLQDSLLMVEIKGVAVRSCKIHDMEISRRYSRIPRKEILGWVSEPFTLEEALATIPKIPLVIKNAPKDTIEAQQTSSTPKPPELNSVFFTLDFDRNLLVEVEQIESIPPDDRHLIKKYLNAKRKVTAREALRSVMHFDPPQQDLWIKIWLNDKDAQAIYRAIPVRAKMALKP